MKNFIFVVFTFIIFFGFTATLFSQKTEKAECFFKSSSATHSSKVALRIR